MHNSYGTVYVEECNQDSNELVSTIRAKKAFKFQFNASSDMDVEHLISAIFKRPPLWDQRDQNHHNRFILDKLWDEVANEFKSQRLTVRKKWKTLRDKFRTTMASIPKPKAGDPGGQVLVSWQYFESLKFLKDQFTPRVSSGNIPKTTTDTIILTQIDDEEDYFEDELRVDVMSPEIIEDEQDRASNFDSGAKASSSSSSSAVNKKSRKRPSSNDDVGQQLIAIEAKKFKYLEDKKNDKQRDDGQNLNFLRSLLPLVEGLTKMEIIAYRIKILQTTQDFLENINNSNNWAPLNPTIPNFPSSNLTDKQQQHSL